ncbi:hypothetical protein QE152_g867 [Popillia japonica]|uniref:Uncharacterized protein n=1 Tax=Popillia japonica TaxID=7064 RepID=A0AAW1N9W1_POPJA
MLYRCNAVNKRNWSRSTGRSRRVTLDAVVVQLAAAGKLARSPSYTRHKHATENVQPSSSECDAILSYTAVQLRFTIRDTNTRPRMFNHPLANVMPYCPILRCNLGSPPVTATFVRQISFCSILVGITRSWNVFFRNQLRQPSYARSRFVPF